MFFCEAPKLSDQLFFRNKNRKEPVNNQTDSSGGINRKSHKNSNFRKVTLMPNNQARKKKEMTIFQRKICKAKIKGDYYEIGVYFFEKIKDNGQ